MNQAWKGAVGKVGSVCRRHFITTSQTCLIVGSGGAGIFLFEGDAQRAKSFQPGAQLQGRAMAISMQETRRTSCFGMLTILGGWFYVFLRGKKLVDLYKESLRLCWGCSEVLILLPGFLLKASLVVEPQR